MEKRCTKCQQIKPLEMFHKDKGNQDGFSTQCKECVTTRKREQYQQNPTKFLERCKIWRQTNKPKIQNYYQENK